MKQDYFNSSKWFWMVPYIRKLSTDKSSLPFTLRIDLTTDCNFNCPFCLYQSKASVIFKDKKYYYPRDSKLDHNKLIKIIKLFAKRGLKSVILTGGGEPFLYDKFYNILDVLFEEKIEVGLITNGTKINKIFIKKYGSNPYLKWIRVSLDSVNSKTWKNMHLPKDCSTFEKTIKNIKLLTENSNRKYLVGINFLVTPLNYREIVPAFNLAKKLKVDNVRYTPVFTKKGKKVYSEIKEELSGKLKEVISKKKPLVYVNLPRFDFLDTPNDTKKCWFSHFSVNLGVDSKLYPCCLKKYIKGMGTSLDPDSFNNDLSSYFEKMKNFNAKSCQDCMYLKFNNFSEYLSKDGRLDFFVP